MLHKLKGRMFGPFPWSLEAVTAGMVAHSFLPRQNSISLGAIDIRLQSLEGREVKHRKPALFATFLLLLLLLIQHFKVVLGWGGWNTSRDLCKLKACSTVDHLSTCVNHNPWTCRRI